jgi:pimeloyl-ACP methyl ester carboxylesterase
VGLYGDSYGTYFAQTFAVRHPDRVKAVVLDAAFAVDGFDPWVREESISLRFAWPEVCRRSTGCGGDVLDMLGRAATRLQARPLTGTSRDADGGRHRLRVDGADLGQMAGDGSFYYTIYRDMAAALSALERGDRVPFLRLAAEDLPFTGGGPVASYSEGAYAAVACHDYPTLWDPAAPFAARRDQLAAARAGLAPDTYAPFPNDIWLKSLYIDQIVTGCLRWPAPAYPDPPVPPGASYPDVPVLVLDGDVDLITPLGDAAAAAALFPNSELVTVRNVGHVTGLADYNGCAARIVRRFLTSLRTGAVDCAERYPEIHVVPEFPRRLAGAPAAQPAGAGDRSTPGGRRAAWATAWSAGDALARWWLMYGSSGHGLRGGSFEASGEYLSYEPIVLRMKGVRFVGDLAVSGVVVWDRSLSTVRARLRLTGAERGRLHIGWSTSATRATAFVRGRIGGRPVRLRTPAP